MDVTVTVGKADNPATVASTASVTKGRNTVDLKNNVTLNGATDNVSYAIAGEANGCTLNGSTLTSGNNTGTVIVNVTVAEDDNYNASTAMTVTVTINDKQTQTITAENVTVTYGETGKSVSATVTNPATGGGAITYAVKAGSEDYIDVNATTGALTIKKAGTAYVVVTAAETDTYRDRQGKGSEHQGGRRRSHADGRELLHRHRACGKRYADHAADACLQRNPEQHQDGNIHHHAQRRGGSEHR